MEIVFSNSALRQLSKMEKLISGRIIRKIEANAKLKEPLKAAERIVDSEFGEWRFRTGHYRAIFDVKVRRSLSSKSSIGATYINSECYNGAI